MKIKKILLPVDAVDFPLFSRVAQMAGTTQKIIDALKAVNRIREDGTYNFDENDFEEEA